MLSPKNRVPAPGRLLAVSGRVSRRQPRADEIGGMPAHDLHPAQRDELHLGRTQVELRPERVPGDLAETSVESCAVGRHESSVGGQPDGQICAE